MRDVFWLFRMAVDRKLEPMGLSQAQWRPLMTLYSAGHPMTQVELASLLGIEAPTLVRLLDRLERKSWIERRAHEGDRRARLVTLTDRATALCSEISTLVADVRLQAIEGIETAELAACCDLLHRVRDRLKTIA